MLVRVVKSLLAFLLPFIWLVSYSLPTSAYEEGVFIREILVFRDIKEEGDRLYFVRYYINLSGFYEPEFPPEENFELVLYDTTGTIVLASRAITEYYNGITSIYLTKDQAGSIKGQALLWGGAYIIRLQGQFGIFPDLIEDVNMDSWVLDSYDYYEETDFEISMYKQAELLSWEIYSSATDLTTVNKRINQVGSYIFTDAVPGIMIYYPNLFSLVVSIPEGSLTNWTKAYINTLGANTQIATPAPTGTAGLRDTIAALGGFIGVTGDWMAFWLTLMAAFVLGGIVYTFSGSSAASLAFSFLVLPFAIWLGLGSALFNLMATIFIVLTIGFGIVFILARFA